MAEININALRKGVLLNGRYIVEDVLGMGGFGITYKGFDQILQIPIAIKEYFPREFVSRSQSARGDGYNSRISLISDQDQFTEGLERFVSEARTLAHFNSRNNGSIVSVTDFFYENGTGYMIMEYLPGKSLKKMVMEMDAPMSEEQIIKLMLPVLEALELIHREKVIHRDISPDNILVNSKGKLTLIDFGSARDISVTPNGLTVVLKHGYAPIEQYTTTDKQGPWTDVYALCATMYFMVTHAVPDVAPNRILTDDLMTLEQQGMPVSHAFSETIRKGLEIRREDRFQNVAELKKALEASGEAGQPAPAHYEGRTEAYDETRKILDFDGTMTSPIYEGSGGKSSYEGSGGRSSYEGSGGKSTNGGPGRRAFYDESISGSHESSRLSENDKMTKLLVLVSVLLVISIAAVGVLIWKSSRAQETDSDQVQKASNTTLVKDDTGNGQSGQTDSGQSAGNDYDSIYGPAEEIHGSYVTEKDEEGGSIDGRENPSTDSSIVDVPEGALVQVLEKRVNSWGSWIKIDYCGVQAWLREDQLTWFSDEDKFPQITESSPSVIVYVYPRSKDFKLRTSPEKDENESNVAERGVPYGTELTVTEIRNGWGKVNYQGKTCWVELCHCRNYFGDHWRVDAKKGIYFRSKPREDAKKVMKERIPGGTSLTTSEKKDGFGKVEYKGKTGWVSLHFLTIE